MNNFGTINKAVSLFLVGGLFLILVGGFFWFELMEQNQKERAAAMLRRSEPGAGLTALGTLVFVATSGVFGVGIQGLAGVFIRRPFQRLASVSWFVFCLGQPSLSKEVFRWRDFFRKQAESHSIYSKFLESKEEAETRRHSFPMLASALFYRSAGTSHLEWVLQHYSTYYLATDVTMVLIISLPWALYQSASTGWPTLWTCVAAGLSLLIYACLCLALHRYLYTSGAWLRHATLVLAVPGAEQEAPLACDDQKNLNTLEAETLIDDNNKTRD